MQRLFIFLLIIAAFTNCKKNNQDYSADIICVGGCWPDSYYAIITKGGIGKTQTILDKNGTNRGTFNNVVLINNLAATDKAEGKKITFSSYKLPVASCQSSYPPAQMEIEIIYRR